MTRRTFDAAERAAGVLTWNRIALRAPDDRIVRVAAAGYLIGGSAPRRYSNFGDAREGKKRAA